MAATSMACGLTLLSRFSRINISKGIATFKKGTLYGPKLNGCVLYRLHSQWHLVGALCLERKPVVSQELTTMEKEFKAYLDKIEVEHSHLSNHELRLMEDMRRASERNENEKKDADADFSNTAQDDEDAYNEELHQFQLAPRTADPDCENNRKNLERHLSKSLVFLVKQKLGNDSRWGLPQAVRQEGETMKQVVERVCKEVCGSNLDAVFLGNAPVGYCKYKYPKAAREDGILGAKVFFFKAWRLSGEVSKETITTHPAVEDYMWATHSELKECLSQKDYRKTILDFLVEDDVSVGRDFQVEENHSQVEETHPQERIEKLQAQN